MLLFTRPQKALFGSVIFLQEVRQELQSNFAVQEGIVGEKDLAHAALADLFDDFVKLMVSPTIKSPPPDCTEGIVSK